MNYTPSRPILVSGIKHCGKSTLGRRLAVELGIEFHDLDDLVVELCRENRGGLDAITWEPREIYRRLGKSGFQELEIGALKRLGERGGLYVLALGGGTPDNPNALPVLSGLGIMVYLYEEAEVLFSRIAARGIPPFLDERAPWESFLELFRHRDTLYRSTADLVVELNGADVQDGAARIRKSLQEMDNVR
ncbi:shikimate kinase [Marispirochaeta aestuarii]|uniref:shikimate kinase n=1 Tax=Marispirochaeta aestuarii TaxID=1963862 RepID=UPI0029C86A93|nr:shikimate kinase [Marispirochaeta aestuarii]